MPPPVGADAAVAPAPAPRARAPVLVLSPTPLAFADGIDARLLAATACCAWLGHAAVAATAWAKLSAGALPDDQALSWGAAFAPQWVSHGAQCMLHVLALLHTVRAAALRRAGRAQARRAVAPSQRR